MTRSRPAGGSRALIGMLSAFALVGGVVGFQNAATAQEAAQRETGVGGDATPAAPVPVTPPEAVPAPQPVVEAPTVQAPAEPAPAVAPAAPAPAAPAPAAPAPAPAPVAPAPVPSGTTGGSGG